MKKKMILKVEEKVYWIEWAKNGGVTKMVCIGFIEPKWWMNVCG